MSGRYEISRIGDSLRRLPHVCRGYDPYGCEFDELARRIDPTRCRVCGFGEEAHRLGATLEAYENAVDALEEENAALTERIGGVRVLINTIGTLLESSDSDKPT